MATTNTLTDKAIRAGLKAAIQAGKPRKLADGEGLHLECRPTGAGWWRLRYRFAGKEGMLSLGTYPAVSLALARERRDEARRLVAAGTDPSEHRQATKKVAKETEGARVAAEKSIARGDGYPGSFKAVALEWHGKQVSNWSPGHADRTKRQLERDLFPWLGDRLMGEIEPMELLGVLQKIEERGANETADRALMLARQVYEYWLPTADKQQRNIAEGLKKRLTPYRGKHFPAIVEPQRFGELLRAMHAYKGGPVVRTALLLAPILYQRPGNLRMMEWAELDLDSALWTIPSAKMKRGVQEKEQGEPHVVPMPTQAVELLRQLHPLTGHGRYVFPGQRDHDRPLSDNSVRTALYALGFGREQSWHGFRASARTMIVDELNLDPLAIEANLAHAVKDSNGRSYNRTQYLRQRFDLVQKWADYLDWLRDGAQVVPLRSQAA